MDIATVTGLVGAIDGTAKLVGTLVDLAKRVTPGGRDPAAATAVQQAAAQVQEELLALKQRALELEEEVLRLKGQLGDLQKRTDQTVNLEVFEPVRHVYVRVEKDAAGPPGQRTWYCDHCAEQTYRSKLLAEAPVAGFDALKCPRCQTVVRVPKHPDAASDQPVLVRVRRPRWDDDGF